MPCTLLPLLVALRACPGTLVLQQPKQLDLACSAHRSMGEPITEDDITSVVQSVDLDGDGKIDYAEFSKVVMTEMS